MAQISEQIVAGWLTHLKGISMIAREMTPRLQIPEGQPIELYTTLLFLLHALADQMERDFTSEIR